MHGQVQKKKEQQGFDLIEAIYAEKGLISGDAARLIAAKAIADTQAHSERHASSEKEKKGRAEFVSGVNARVQAKRAGFLIAVGTKPKQKSGKKPLQMKKPGVDPDKG